MALNLPDELPSENPVLLGINADWVELLIGVCQDYLYRPSSWDDFDNNVLENVDELILRLMGYQAVPVGFLTDSSCNILTDSNGEILTGTLP